MTEQEIISGCKTQNRAAQKCLYDRYAAILYPVARRYVRHQEDAEDVLIQSFYKIMSKIAQYQGKGSFEGWMRRVVVNESLMFLRKRHNFHISIDHIAHSMSDGAPSVETILFEKDILEVVNSLPTGYRTVFNLYVIEGYKHREIAEELGISINTSKSQLIQAKRKISGLLKKNKNIA